MNSINDLSNEFVIKNLLLEMYYINIISEPNFEKSYGQIDLTKDTKFGIRYANFVALTKAVFSFIDRVSLIA
jgi:hypothetical protein